MNMGSCFILGTARRETLGLLCLEPGEHPEVETRLWSAGHSILTVHGLPSASKVSTPLP